jgi:hypothetical protein
VITSLTLSYGTANGVAYLNGSKVLTTGSALTFDGTTFYGANAKFGNGAASNTSKLMVNTTSGTAAGIQLFQDGIESWIMGMPASSSGLAWSNSGVEQMRLTSTGLGIGTSSPAYKLDVTGSARVGGATSKLYFDTTGSAASSYIGTTNDFDLTIFNGRGGNPNIVLNNTAGIQFKASTTVQAVIDSAGNLGLGVTPSAWGGSNRSVMQFVGSNAIQGSGSLGLALFNNAYNNGTNDIYSANGAAYKHIIGTAFQWFTAPSGTAGNAITFTQAMTLDASGNLLVGKTAGAGARIDVVSESGGAALQVRNDTAAITTVGVWNDATSGNNTFVNFYTEAAGTTRGSITYNRAGGLVAYNVTSDYRAKDIYGPVQNPGTLIDSVPVYMGKMKDATQERPMFIAHETPAYAHTGEKDAVDADGNPVYQQMDASALIPVMWAEIQSLRKRLTALEST